MSVRSTCYEREAIYDRYEILSRGCGVAYLFSWIRMSWFYWMWMRLDVVLFDVLQFVRLRSHAIGGNPLHSNWFEELRLKVKIFTFNLNL